ncbi:nucleotidyltransferase [Aurantibacillus circumpalustris]|uniref:nucleotidyltransferase n=1 Tax=Aurantibacillus circumpalustris TaxID=3036359 RepID=UPI00295B198E|nr:nucleotidyltransferase [Aurantibacillus circumpalustris]
MGIDQDFKEFIELLNKHNVEYLVVGGYAVAMYGYPRYTGDIDFWVKPSTSNAKKIILALNDFGFGGYDISENDFCEVDNVVQLGYPPNRIDIITGVTSLNFDDCFLAKKNIEIENVTVNFISLFHLRLNKSATGRDKDKNDLNNLPEK